MLSVDEAARRYPLGPDVDICLVLSHRKRMELNAALNARAAHGRQGVVLVPVPEAAPKVSSSTAMQPQDMLLYPGIVLVGCSRSGGKILNGVTYEVTSVDADKVELQMTAEFSQGPVLLAPQQDAAAVQLLFAPFVAAVRGLLVENGPRSFRQLDAAAVRGLTAALRRRLPTANVGERWRAFARLFPQDFRVQGQTLALREEEEQQEEADDDDEGAAAAAAAVAVEDAPVTLKLSHAEASKNLRLTFALCYATVQGRTLRDKHIVLLDTRHRFFTMRHLIVGLSRATAGRFVHVQSKRYQDVDRLLTTVVG